MKLLVRFTLVLNWMIIVFMAFFIYKEKFMFGLIPLFIALLHVYVLGHNEFTKDAISYYLKRQAKRARHKFHKKKKNKS